MGLTVGHLSAIGALSFSTKSNAEAIGPQAVTQTENDWHVDGADQFHTQAKPSIELVNADLSVTAVGDEGYGDNIVPDITTVEDTNSGYLTSLDIDFSGINGNITKVSLDDAFGEIEVGNPTFLSDMDDAEPIGTSVILDDYLIIPYGDIDVFDASIEGWLVAFDPETLVEEWIIPLGEFDISFSDLLGLRTVSDGTYGYIATSEFICSFDPAEPDLRWVNELSDVQANTLTVGTDRLYAARDDLVISVDTQSGEDVETSGPLDGVLNAPLTIHDGTDESMLVVVSNEQSQTIFFDRDTLTIVNTVGVSHGKTTQMCISHGESVFVLSEVETDDGIEERVVKIDPDTGIETTSEVLPATTGRLIAGSDHLIRGSDEQVDVLTRETLTVIETLDMTDELEGGTIDRITPLASGDIALEEDGTVYRLTGERIEIEGPTSEFEILTPSEDRIACRIVEFQETATTGTESIESYHWTVVDEEDEVVDTGTGSSFTTVFPAEGTYTVTLMVVDGFGFEDTATQQVSIDEGEESDLDVVVGVNPPRDLNADGLYRDIDGNCEFDIGDVQALFFNLHSDAVQENAQAFNFSGMDADEVTIFDVQALFRDLEAGVSQ